MVEVIYVFLARVKFLLYRCSILSYAVHISILPTYIIFFFLYNRYHCVCSLMFRLCIVSSIYAETYLLI